MAMKKYFSWLAVLVVALMLAVWFFTALGGVQQGTQAQEKRQLEIALRRGAVACYAAEGFYPPSLEYLCQHYGAQVDESRYMVFYEVVAENLMPQITVIERTK